MKVMLIIMLSGFFLNTQLLFSMQGRDPEQEKKKIEQMAKRSVEEKQWKWRELFFRLVSAKED